MRNADKMLTALALRNGAVEQYAIDRSIVRHVVSLVYAGEDARRPWVVTHTCTTASIKIEEHQWHFDSLDDARRRWKAEVRRARG